LTLFAKSWAPTGKPSVSTPGPSPPIAIVQGTPLFELQQHEPQQRCDLARKHQPHATLWTADPIAPVPSPKQPSVVPARDAAHYLAAEDDVSGAWAENPDYAPNKSQRKHTGRVEREVCVKQEVDVKKEDQSKTTLASSTIKQEQPKSGQASPRSRMVAEYSKMVGESFETLREILEEAGVSTSSDQGSILQSSVKHMRFLSAALATVRKQYSDLAKRFAANNGCAARTPPDAPLPTEQPCSMPPLETLQPRQQPTNQARKRKQPKESASKSSDGHKRHSSVGATAFSQLNLLGTSDELSEPRQLLPLSPAGAGELDLLEGVAGTDDLLSQYGLSDDAGLDAGFLSSNASQLLDAESLPDMAAAMPTLSGDSMFSLAAPLPLNDKRVWC